MLTKIKQYWDAFWIWIVAAAIAVVYLIGKTNGANNEKIRQNKKILQNLGTADKARRRLDNPDVVRKLRKKYSRK